MTRPSLQDLKMPVQYDNILLIYQRFLPLMRPSLQDGDCVASHPVSSAKSGYDRDSVCSLACIFANSPELPPAIGAVTRFDFSCSPHPSASSFFAIPACALSDTALYYSIAGF